MIGQTISHYKILEKLGEGGMGVVFKAEDTKLKRIVAIKFLPKQLSAHIEERERFIHEAQAASSLNHPNICVIHEIDEVDGESFIVMEYIDGSTLREWIRKKEGQGYRKQSMKESVDIATQIAEGLGRAHEKGIIHRDMKSENIMVTSDGRVKVMDFGLAKLRGVSKLTKTGSTVGTVAYMSPEQVEGVETDHRTDIFSFGVVLYEMLTGHLPFRAEHEPAMMYEIVNIEPPSLIDQHKDFDVELNNIVMKCLEKDREERYQSMREVFVDLKRYKRDSEGRRIERKTFSREMPPLSAPTTSEEPSRAPKTKWLRIGGALFTAVILIGLGIYFLIPRTKAIDSIAVLPFINVNADSTIEYLSDGITENLINSLTQLSNLRVIPRSTAFHYKGKDIDPREVGNTLKVRSLLMGRVIQRGGELNIQLDLIDIATEAQIWGTQYNRKLSDLATVQEEIVRGVSQRLQPGMSSEEKTKMARGITTNTEAFQLYLKGCFYWNKRRLDDIKTAIEFFKQAIEKDPSYALAYAGLASAYVLVPFYGIPPGEWYTNAQNIAVKALEIDSTLAEAHTVLGLIAQDHYYDWEGAEKHFRRAIELDPGYPTAHQWYSVTLSSLGRVDEALSEAKRAQELDPLSLVINVNVGDVFYTMKQYDKSIAQYENALALDQTFPWAHSGLAFVYVMQGRFEEAIAECIKAKNLGGDISYTLVNLGWVYVKSGRKTDARRVLEELLRLAQQGNSVCYGIAFLYYEIGEKDKAFEWFEKSYQGRETGLFTLGTDPLFGDLRSEPRCIALLKKMGLEK